VFVKPNADILVVSPHPDDAEICAGGTLAAWAAQGKCVVLAACTSGEKGTSNPDLSPEQLAEIREREQRASAEVLGLREVVFMRFPDQGLEDTPAFRKEIVRLIRMYRPRVLVTCDPYRRYITHRDHRIVGLVCLDAVFPYARDHLAYPDFLDEGLLPHKVKEMFFWFSDDVNYRSDISATFATKLKAIKCHESQIREFGIPDLAAWLTDMGKEMSAGESFDLAEAFHRIEAPP
jgi:LmbE family N-acetylglucosaminyl deacetylase